MGEVNTAEEKINVVSGAAGQVKISQGPNLPPVWGAPTGMSFVAVLSIDQTWVGITVTAQAGEILTIGQSVYMKNDGKMWRSDANAVTTMPAVALATAGMAANAYGVFLLLGFFREDAVFNFGVAGVLYASAAALGALTTAAPAGAGDQVQVCGQCFPSAHIIYFHPDLTLVELV